MEKVTTIQVFPFKGFYDAHVDAYRDEMEFQADPLRYHEERDYREGKLLDCQADWDEDYIAGKAPTEWAR